MSSRGTNEGFRVLDEFVSEAIHSSDVQPADPSKQGRNEGMRVVQEIELDSPSSTTQPKLAEGADDGRRRHLLGGLVRVALKVACIAVASGAGAALGGWIGASVGAILSSVIFLGGEETGLGTRT